MMQIPCLILAAVSLRRIVGVALAVLALAAPKASAQVPVEVRSTAPASGWTSPAVGETITVTVTAGAAATPTPLRFFGLKLFYRPDAFEIVSRSIGPLTAGSDFDDSDGTSDGFRVFRHDTDVYGSGRNAVSFSVALFDGAPLISADGRVAITVVLRVRATGLPPERYALAPGEVEARGADAALLPVTYVAIRQQAIGGGIGIDPPPVTFPEVGGVDVDFSDLSASTTLTASRSEAAPTGTQLPAEFVAIASGTWTLALSNAATFAGEVCFPFSYIEEPPLVRSSIRIHKRADAASPWVELPTRLAPNAVSPVSVCATVTGFSDFTITAPTIPLPVELTSFTAAADGNAVVLRWRTESETGNAGFGVEIGSNGTWREAAFVPGRGTTSEAHAYTYRAAGLAPGTYRFRLRQVDLDGAEQRSAVVEATVTPAGGAALSAPWPNPATTAAVVRATLATAGPVRLAVYDLTGRRVAVLHDGAMPAGTHAVPIDAGGLPGGVYVVRLETPAAVQITRLIVAH